LCFRAWCFLFFGNCPLFGFPYCPRSETKLPLPMPGFSCRKVFVGATVNCGCFFPLEAAPWSGFPPALSYERPVSPVFRDDPFAPPMIFLPGAPPLHISPGPGPFDISFRCVTLRALSHPFLVPSRVTELLTAAPPPPSCCWPFFSFRGPFCPSRYQRFGSTISFFLPRLVPFFFAFFSQVSLSGEPISFKGNNFCSYRYVFWPRTLVSRPGLPGA